MIACPLNPRPILLSLVLLTLAALGANSSETTTSGLPLPRFVSLSDDRVNVRAGPGKRFPINWVYLRKGLPVEVIGEFGHWRRTRDIDGVVGWIHLSMLSGRRTVIITTNNPETAPLTLHRGPDTQSTPIARVEIGAHGRLLECEKSWCRIKLAPYRGWLPKNILWGLNQDEQID